MNHRLPIPNPIRVALLAALIFFLSCRGVAFASVSIADEIEMGRKFDETIHAQMAFVEDPEVIFYVTGVVDRVASALPPQAYPIRSAVVANNSMNAFAIPGGYIYIFTGLILGVESEDQLAAVIGHELGHVTERHVAKRMEQMKYLNIASLTGMVAGVLLGASGAGGNIANLGGALTLGSAAGAQSAFLMYTRENEREADHVGLNYLVKSGYNPNAMPQTFEIMNKKSWFMSGDNIPSYLSTHPGLDERIVYLRDRIKHMPADVLTRDFKRDRFQRVQTILRARMVSPETALAYWDSKPQTQLTCLDQAGRGIVLDRLKRQQQAEQAFAKALGCGPDDPLVLREAGIFYFNQGNANKAAPLLQKAAILNPRDAMSMFFTARIMAERKDYAGAISLMERVAREVPKDSEVRYHLGRIKGESGDIFGAHIQLSYSSHFGRDKQKARFHLDKARSLAQTDAQKRQLEELERTISGPGEDKKNNGKAEGAKLNRMRLFR
ncbi:Putative Zn-dependent protease, contains TPR repeats [Humidesulfovibrio mexicanus]|uniref:Putative Zn-dependent protease, contains TPR repeats n=1 Tax=Humidesulfovibrio mexicanus TaxID=147047 RepID=A0A238XMC4_9BACT|nr:M48 family metallopeptidase [Humidesulfovibrio mexicanus]SNR59721.1 Putative Zn-dependent protease, contains TPR repeats [Humidesulfovibrio mexicanus]